MGIAKIRNRHLQNTCVKQGLYLPEAEQEQQEHEHLYDPIVDFDDYDFVEPNSECIALEDQLISIPYDLYCLPDLKEILSLDAWNTCLDEEDRFKLSSLLPDLDQQTFWLTLKELLNGENVFFGSPLLCFSHRLKGGFYSSSVLQSWEVLQALEKRKYFHCLRSYHEKMTQVFKDMQKNWSTCLPGVNVEDRLKIWKKKKEQSKLVFSVDLNAPPDDEIFPKGERISDDFQSIKRTRCENDEIYYGLPITNPRGVLKIKPVLESAHTDISQPLPCNLLATFRPQPKGVMKVKSKSCAMGRQDMSRSTNLSSSSMPSISGSLLQSHKFPLATKYNTKKGTENFYEGSEFAISEDSDKRSCRTNAQYWETQRLEPPFPIIRKMKLQDFHEKRSMGVKVYCRRTNSCRREDSGSHGHNSVLENGRSMPSMKSRFSATTNTGLEAYNLTSTGKDVTDGYLAAASELACLDAPSEVAFPITYRRKKPYLKRKSLSLKHAVHIADIGARTLQQEDYRCLRNSQNM